MKKLVLFALLAGTAASLRAADKIVVTVTNNLAIARPAEVIAVPFSEVQRLLPGAMIDHLKVTDWTGAVLPYQVTNFDPNEHVDHYRNLLFQHYFAAGEKSATFTIQKTAKPVPPFRTMTFARYVPERFDDFAWENDRIAHRIYGPGLNTPAAGPDRMISSGIDVWCKRVRYPIINRWYLKGHYHVDSGEGLDMYNTGRSRGCGGTGIWNHGRLYVSGNWATWKILANGPIRTVFDITYAPWDAGHGIMVGETKRFTVDAGHNLDRIRCTYTITGAKGVTVGIGLNRDSADPGQDPKIDFIKDEDNHAIVQWEAERTNGSIGEAVIVKPDEFAGYASDKLNHLILVKATADQPIVYWAGAGWTRSGDFSSEADWKAYITTFAQCVNSPIRIARIEAE